jgi:hypothetical protein
MNEINMKYANTFLINKIDFCFYSKLVNKLCQVMHDDTEDDDDGQQHQSSLTKPTTSPNGYSLTSSNSNTTDG